MTRQIKTIGDMLGICSRRKWIIITIAASVFITAAVVALSLPKKYRSTATILIEAQEVPSEYVKANISSYADQRIQTINQRIMGSPRLLDIVKRFRLYGARNDRVATEALIERMRSDIKFTPISADLADPRSGRPGQTTIAFSITYEGSDPVVVQQVASELSLLYLAENLKGRDKQSAGTFRFLQEEMVVMEQKVAAIDRRIAVFKQENIDTLPELSQVNVQAYEQVDREIRLLNDQLRAAREKEGNMVSQLTMVEPESNTNHKESLRQLKLVLTDLKSRFSELHPDVKKVRFEIAELENEIKARNDNRQVDNPAYVTLTAQLAGTRSDIDSLRRQIAAMTSKRETYQRRIHSSPHVEEGYKAILLERDTLQQKYNDLAKKTMEASLAHVMEKEQLGERFTLVDPARLPHKPTGPNVPAIILLGLIVGLGAGVSLAVALESFDDSLRLPEELSALSGFIVLATIPDFGAAVEVERNKKSSRLPAPQRFWL